ncbi:pimeloyl-ACP methyl ester carboxylesterase [Rubricella aquisinus]|uniref:Pimeloyl-ACP methyl ester carboxylesterase n=1 Tax=Rubricella aquisinus TaxID=2028108 RepID=A0A840X407_9RHOB|nr:alpha/beta fold hydrolase [Rubricella aquisinus]MBB5515397.1 pimeloyl-ACP methyl ester carboxylesterase [Rubricella aquisinus]
MTFASPTALPLAALTAVLLIAAPAPVRADSTFDHLRAFYALDPHMPQTVEVQSDAPADGVRRVEFTFTGFDNQIVPARLDVPNGAENPPVILLLHGLTQSRAQWWRTDEGPYSFPSSHRAALVEAGFAVLAFDARKHGERRVSTDFENPYIYLENGYFDATRKFIADTAIDVRSAVDALDQIDGVDASRVGVTGFSLGAFVGYLAAAVDPRIDAGLFIALPLLPVSAGEAASFTSPFSYTEGFGARPMGLIAGTEDPLYTIDGMEALAAQMSGQTQLTWIDSGHDFPHDTADVSVRFFTGAL